MNSNHYNFGIIYRRTNPFWNEVQYLVEQLKAYNNITVKELDVTDYNKDSLPTDLDIVTLLPADRDVLPDVLNLNKNIKWIHSMSAGVELYRGIIDESIPLSNCKGAFSLPLAEWSIYSMLHYAYQGPTFLDGYKDRKWVTPTCTKLTGKTVSIIGYGLNGLALGKICKNGFNMKVVGVKKDVTKGLEHLDEVYAPEDLDKALQCADFVVNTLPVTKETTDIFNYARFSQMKKTAVFINIGRGVTVLEDDLLRAMKEKLIHAAALDVNYIEPLSVDSGLYEQENVFLSCHHAHRTDERFKAAVGICLNNLNSFMNENGKLVTFIDRNKWY
jgi:phosphoglycerate dehydrogenase-like enzyme